MRDWRDRAACLGMDPELFFPPPGIRPDRAKKVCVGCPVQEQCLAFALDMEKEGEARHRCGVYGNTTAHQRRHLSPTHLRDNPRELCRKKLHAMTSGNVRVDDKGHRRCLACLAAANRAAYERRVAAA